MLKPVLSWLPSSRMAGVRSVFWSTILLAPSAWLAADFRDELYEVPDYAPFILDERVEREDYNFKYGPLMIDLIGTFGIEYDDNINTSENNEVDDWILQPGVSFGLKWQINEYQELDLNIGLEYWYYLDESDLNDFDQQLNITPDTELSFRVLVGDMVFRVYDKINYTSDSSDAVVLDDMGNPVSSDATTFSRYTNVVGVQSEWYITEYAFKGQVSRKDVWSTEDEFEYIDRYEHKFALNVERDIAANFMAGVGASYTDFEYDEDVNDSGDVFTIGPYFDWGITEVISLYVGVAWNSADFDGDGLVSDEGEGFGDEDKYEEFSGTARLSHTVNEVYNHQLEVYRIPQMSDASNYEELDGIRYSFAYNINSRVRLDGDVAYEESDSSGGLIDDDDYDRWVAGLATEVVLGPRLTGRFAYRYVDKDSDAPLRSYERNRFRILFEYDF